jgi:hypothetical protein
VSRQAQVRAQSCQLCLHQDAKLRALLHVTSCAF